MAYCFNKFATELQEEKQISVDKQNKSNHGAKCVTKLQCIVRYFTFKESSISIVIKHYNTLKQFQISCTYW